MKKISIIALGFIALAACEKVPSNSSESLTIRAGFEEEDGSKTFLKDPSAGTVWWGTTGNDKVVYGFTEGNVKYAFTSSSEASEATRSFTCDTWPGGAWTYAIWTGQTSGNDKCSLSAGVFTGTSLKLSASQTINNSKSFAPNSNIAVMKHSDGAFRPVFGYLRFTLPDYPGLANRSAIKHVQFTADENVAGEIRIDYSGAAPVATVIDNANASKSITLNARLKAQGPQGYEAGYVYMILPPGTYHNAYLTITPFTSDPLTSAATTGEPFTVNFDGDVVVQRGKYADVGTLPTEAAPVPFTWPTPQEGDFDYGLAPGGSATATYDSSLLSGYGVSSSNRELPSEQPISMNGVTYYGGGILYYGNRMSTQKVNNEWSTEYPNVIPASRCFSFRINRPGTLRFYQSLGSGTDRIPTYYLAIISTVNSSTSARIIHEVTPSVVTDTRPGGDPVASPSSFSDLQDYIVSIPVTEEDLEGIESAATIYLYHRYTTGNTCQVHYYPLHWTVASSE
ncbi:MAG: hypothetical protein J5835_02945 [Bacteroidales bacterium]|nr:hypothetical protein [Bacteroidales bacterium]